ncbi:MAG: VOC family protein [Actinobacteria bacterium]|nr:VOC family protein [Actinomycetota bacterium]
MPFKAKIHAVTLGVADLERSLSFYRDGLGLPTDGITGTQYAGDETTPAGAVAMFNLDDGLILSLYPRAELAKDAGLDPTGATRPTMSIGHFVDSRAEVDRLLDLAGDAGATIHGEAHERPWGIYSGYFSDPDGHLWEVLHFEGVPDPEPARS